LNEYVQKGNSRSKERIYVVHRLDRETSGILIFAKSENVKKYLQDNWKDFSKKYIAVVHGILKQKEGTITSYLAENKVFRVYSVKDPANGKLAKTGYRVIKEQNTLSLLEIDLFTGRKNQIRVHFSENGHPVIGDKIYGNGEKGFKRLGLHSSSLTIKHPFSKKEMTFQSNIPEYFKSLLKT
jgi:tRNA pseudouridine32 synthase/23S rRNA pseudouridine746 synthase/23S rRNA pseudouridine1911/1915/1917 synthase